MQMCILLYYWANKMMMNGEQRCLYKLATTVGKTVFFATVDVP